MDCTLSLIWPIDYFVYYSHHCIHCRGTSPPTGRWCLITDVHCLRDAAWVCSCLIGSKGRDERKDNAAATSSSNASNGAPPSSSGSGVAASSTGGDRRGRSRDRSLSPRRD
jgi:hypothetical protein